MSKFLKFIVHLVVVCTILCVVALAVPPFFGVTTVVMDDPDTPTNLPVGSVTYAIPVKTEEVTMGTRILVEEDGKTYRYNIVTLDTENGTGTVTDPTVSGAETLTVAVKNYVPKVVITIGLIGYLQVATKSMEGLIILGLAVLFLVILYVIAELWKKDPDEEEEEEDEVYVKTRKELRKEEKERERQMDEDDRQLLKAEKERKKQERKNKKIIKTGGFVDEIYEDDLEPEETEDRFVQNATAQEAASEAHELLKKEIAATTAEVTGKKPASAKKKARPKPVQPVFDEEDPFLDDEEEEPVEIKKMAIPSYSAAQLAQRARRAGDRPDVMKEEITQVTLFDYSDIIAGGEDEDDDDEE
jgi:hypothetical protein